MKRHDVLRVVTLLALLTSLLSAPTRAQEPPWIFGMHDPGAEGEMEARGKRGFIVFTEAIGIDPNDHSGKDYWPWSSRGHGVIVRLNNGYGGSGTLPRESQYPAFAQRVANFIQNSPGADIWIVGNETNLSREWPGNVNADPSTGEAITPARYVSCYNQIYTELQRRGLTNEILVPAPTGTWAPPYDGTLSYLPNRGVPGFLDYWTQVLNALGPTKVRGLAIHTYTHGSDPTLITSTQKMGWPYQDVFYHFLVYRNFMARIPTAFRALPVWITESNQTRDQPGYNWDPDARSIPWIANAYAEINAWNSTAGNQKIHTLALFRWPDVWEGDRNYCVSCVGSAVEGFRQALTRDYRWTTDNPPPAGNDADIDRGQSTVPGSAPSAGSDVVLRVRNTGGTTWSAGAGYRLGTTSTNQFHLEAFACGGYSNSPTDGRVFLCGDVAPGQTAELRFRIRPSVSAGAAKLSLRMVRDGVQWFGDTESWDVTVSSPSGCPTTDFAVPSDRYKLEIWNNRTLTGEPVERRTDFVGAGGFEQNWGTGKASSCTGNDNFSIRFSRRFQLSTAGTYRFTTTTDDGVRLYVNGGLVIDQWKDQAPTSYQATISLAAGWHDLRMDYYENGGGAYAKLDWLLVTPSGGNDADIDRTQSTVPGSVPPAGSDVVLRVRNTGGTTWSAGAGYRLGTTSTNQFHLEGFACGGYSNSPTNARVFLCNDVLPGQTAELRFRFRPSVSSGVAKLSLRMVRDGVQWFGDTENWDVTVSSPSGCPATDFAVPSDRYKLEIWNNRTLTGEPVERRADFVGAGGFEQNWGTGKASSCTGNDNFSIRFSRRFQLATPGTYRFSTTTDDGVRLYIDGALLIDQWKDQAPTSYQATLSLAAGWHDLRMDYYENGGGAYAKLDWLLVTPSGGNDADIDRGQSTVPSSAPPTGSNVVLRVHNTGGTTWSAGAGYRLGTTSTNQFHLEGFACGGYSNSPTNARVFLCDDVPPGQTAELRFHIRPSVSSGVAKLSLRMVRDGVQWFGDTESWDVTVSTTPPPTTNRVARIGFHVGPAGNQRGLGDWMRRLDAAGIPFFLKSIDSGGQILEAARLREVSGVPHVLVFRATGDVPNYDLPPEQAAREHWQFHESRFPPELVPYKQWIWVETVNEIDKNRSEWLGRFAYETSLLAMNDGFRWAAFGWSSGEPEPEHWEGPEMLRFLRLASENPDQIAIALHEYSFTIDRIDEGFPWLVGRFQKLFDVADRYGLERPTVVITEWGWEYQRVPDPATAMAHIRWADELYEPQPQVLGAAIWYLGPGFGGISDLAQKLIAPVTDYYLQKYGTTSASPPLPILP